MKGSAPYGFYGDDFTGATDTLAHLARAGLRTMLFFEPPTDAQLAACGTLDALGIAGAARSMMRAALTTELARVGARFAELGVQVMHYKVCSTFDSSPVFGSIGAAVATLHPFFPNPLVPIVGGQPGLQRYCVFGHLFAAASPGTSDDSAGSDGTGADASPVHRIDRHPTMSRHPVTPMGEADLREHLQQQGLAQVASIDWRAYGQTRAALAALVARQLDAKPAALLFDALRDDDLVSIGNLLVDYAARTPMLVVGASSVAQAWAYATRAERNAAAPSRAGSNAIPGRARGPVFVLAGSLSPMTATQIEAAHSYWKIELDPADMAGSSARLRVNAIVERLRSGEHVLAFTGRTPRGASEPDGQASREQVARQCAALVREVLDAVKLARIGIAGGDTSSYTMQALDAWGLSYLAPLGPGVAMCRLHANRPDLDGIEVMLKGGQMGEPDLFERLVTGQACASAS